MRARMNTVKNSYLFRQKVGSTASSTILLKQWCHT